MRCESQPLVIDYNLPYPTGTAVGTMIRSFFNDGANARQQALMMFRVRLLLYKHSASSQR